VIAVGSEKLWRAFGPAIGHAELVDHPAYATNSKRVKNRVELESFLARFSARIPWRIGERSFAPPASRLADRRLDEVVNDAQCEEREIFVYADPTLQVRYGLSDKVPALHTAHHHNLVQTAYRRGRDAGGAKLRSPILHWYPCRKSRPETIRARPGS